MENKINPPSVFAKLTLDKINQNQQNTQGRLQPTVQQNPPAVNVGDTFAPVQKPAKKKSNWLPSILGVGAATFLAVLLDKKFNKVKKIVKKTMEELQEPIQKSIAKIKEEAFDIADIKIKIKDDSGQEQPISLFDKLVGNKLSKLSDNAAPGAKEVIEADYKKAINEALKSDDFIEKISNSTDQAVKNFVKETVKSKSSNEITDAKIEDLRNYAIFENLVATL